MLQPGKLKLWACQHDMGVIIELVWPVGCSNLNWFDLFFRRCRCRVAAILLQDSFPAQSMNKAWDHYRAALHHDRTVLTLEASDLATCFNTPCKLSILVASWPILSCKTAFLHSQETPLEITWRLLLIMVTQFWDIIASCRNVLWGQHSFPAQAANSTQQQVQQFSSMWHCASQHRWKKAML